MCWWRSKYVKVVVAVYVYGSIGWGVDNFVGAEVYITSIDEVYSDIGDVVGEGFELEVGGEVFLGMAEAGDDISSVYGICGIKFIKGGVDVIYIVAKFIDIFAEMLVLLLRMTLLIN